MYTRETWNTILHAWKDERASAEYCLKWAMNADGLLSGSLRDEWVSAILDLACMLEQGIDPS